MTNTDRMSFQPRAPDLHAIAAFAGGLACVAGVAAIVFLSGFVGWQYWIDQNNQPNAWMTIGFELIAAGGIAAAMMHRGDHKWKVRIAAWTVVAVTAGWCGYTQYQSLQAEQLTLARTAIETTPRYLAANETLLKAQQAYYAALNRTAPDCNCPLTLAEWNSDASVTARAAEIEQKHAAMTRAESAVDELIPTPAIEPMLIFRGAAIEIVKLFGLPLFGVGLGALYASHRQRNEKKRPAPQRPKRPTTKRPKSPQDGNVIDFGAKIDVAYRLEDQGVPQSKICEQTGLSKGSLYRILKQRRSA